MERAAATLFEAKPAIRAAKGIVATCKPGATSTGNRKRELQSERPRSLTKAPGRHATGRSVTIARAPVVMSASQARRSFGVPLCSPTRPSLPADQGHEVVVTAPAPGP